MTTIPPVSGAGDIRRSRVFSEQITFTIDFLRSNFRVLGRSVVYIVGLVALAAGLAGIMARYAVSSMTESMDYHTVATLSAGMGILAFIFTFIAIVLQVALVNSYVALYLERGNGAIGVKDVWNRMRGILWRTFRLVFGIAVLGLVILGFMFRALDSGLYTGLVFAVPGILLATYFIIRLTPFFTAALQEDATFSEAMARSKELMHGHWWSTFGLMAVIYGVIAVLVLMLQLPAYIIGRTPLLIFSGYVLEPLFIIFQFAKTILSSFLFALPVLAGTLHYFNLVEKVDAVGIMKRIEDFGVKDETPSDVPSTP